VRARRLSALFLPAEDVRASVLVGGDEEKQV
jgi:hypothetical protein